MPLGTKVAPRGLGPRVRAARAPPPINLLKGSGAILILRLAGLEPARYYYQLNLNQPCLPISSQSSKNVTQNLASGSRSAAPHLLSAALRAARQRRGAQVCEALLGPPQGGVFDPPLLFCASPPLGGTPKKKRAKSRGLNYKIFGDRVTVTSLSPVRLILVSSGNLSPKVWGRPSDPRIILYFYVEFTSGPMFLQAKVARRGDLPSRAENKAARDQSGLRYYTILYYNKSTP